jgi:hypothetical protein
MKKNLPIDDDLLNTREVTKVRRKKQLLHI